MKIIGLTGGIASGKSTVARMIRRKGIPVICADDLARRAVRRGRPALKKIARIFGPGVITRNGELNRPLLGKIVFASSVKRKKLNQIMHPLVVKEMQKAISKNKKKKLIVLDVPLLFEEKLDRLCDKTVVIYAPATLQKKRLKKRNRLSDREIRNRLKSQMPIEKKKKLADYVIDNSGAMAQTSKQVNKLITLFSLPNL